MNLEDALFLIYRLIEWIGYDNDNMKETLLQFNLTPEILREIGHEGYAAMLEEDEQWD